METSQNKSPASTRLAKDDESKQARTLVGRSGRFVEKKQNIKKGMGRWAKLWPSRARYMPTHNEVSQTVKGLGPQERYILGLLVLILFGAIFAVFVQVYILQTILVPSSGGDYREGIIGFPEFINPVLAPSNTADRDISELVYSSLLTYNNQGEIIPDLAETYEVLEGGRSYRFKLKENIAWEDGAPITAQDVVFTIQTIQDPQYASPLLPNWQGVDVTSEGDNRVIFKLSTPYVPFLENATVGILPKHIWENVPPQSFRISELNLQPVGSGPFKAERFVKRKKDGAEFISSYTLVKNEAYHGTAPYLNRIIFKFYNSQQEIISAYNARAVDGMAFLSATNVDRIKDPDSITLHEFKLPRYFAIFFNQNENKILEDERLREALSLSMDRDRIIEEILNGFAQKVDTPIPPNLTKYYNNDIETTPYDIEGAIELLEDANWIDDDNDGIREKIFKEGEEPIKLEISMQTLQWPELESVALELSEQWNDLGIRVSVDFHELGTLQQDIIRPRSYEMLMFGEIFGTIPDPFSFWHSSQTTHPGLNLAIYESNKVDTILEDAREELDDITREELYKEFQEEVVEDIPALFLYDPTYIYPVHRAVQGIEESFIADPSNRFIGIEKWFVQTRRVFK